MGLFPNKTPWDHLMAICGGVNKNARSQSYFTTFNEVEKTDDSDPANSEETSTPDIPLDWDQIKGLISDIGELLSERQAKKPKKEQIPNEEHNNILMLMYPSGSSRLDRRRVQSDRNVVNRFLINIDNQIKTTRMLSSDIKTRCLNDIHKIWKSNIIGFMQTNGVRGITPQQLTWLANLSKSAIRKTVLSPERRTQDAVSFIKKGLAKDLLAERSSIGLPTSNTALAKLERLIGKYIDIETSRAWQKQHPSYFQDGKLKALSVTQIDELERMGEAIKRRLKNRLIQLYAKKPEEPIYPPKQDTV